MPYIITRNWSHYTDQATNTHFLPVLDQNTGCFIGSAHVSEERAELFEDRRGFEVLSESDHQALIQPPVPEVEPELPASITGDPLADAAKRKKKDKPALTASTQTSPKEDGQSGPPEPPTSR